MVGHTETLPGHTAPPAGALVVPECEIIPVKAIPLLGIVVAGLVAAILSERLWPLVFFHVVASKSFMNRPNQDQQVTSFYSS